MSKLENIHALQGQNVKIYLKEKIIIEGLITSVDPGKVELKNCVINGNKQKNYRTFYCFVEDIILIGF